MSDEPMKTLWTKAEVPAEFQEVLAAADARAKVRLFPCPFCGERAELKTGIHTQYVICLNCETMGPNLASPSECIAAWNRRAALTAALSDQAGGWQDISTAPKDGTWVLGWTVDDIDNEKWPRCSVVKWRTVGRTHWKGPGFYDDRIFYVADLAYWQPLPAPPPSSTAGEVG